MYDLQLNIYIYISIEIKFGFLRSIEKRGV